ncbi:MAG: GNAT family N-acetyltransferase [Acidimicrobiia bacterium]|nr:GNAT family N-acetyltransferase [Acidimicrobiia bacterium]
MRIRTAELQDADSLARVHVDSWRSTYAGILPDEFLAGLSYRDRESFWEQVLTTARPTVSNFLAETASGHVVGLAAGGPERTGNKNYLGELYLVYLLEQYQRRGLGRLLVSAVAERLLADGFDSMLLWVAKDNHPACRFYEALGGELIDSRTIDIAGAGVAEVAYGWQQVADLLTDQAGV